ncbi:stage II sporulation protein M [Synechocystis sp. FACHB-383]|uniref:stage II sporulation protein M n=1 Tax=Synechocystis sp. FACHB-383 TaxID=2692864 RepID=UPI001688C5CF|nr:stage II sporulation protein M [Synechocystis sp. FACHB-383]MBD2655547.1 stage II sporulation protein M [Synechocystis sp. FACHB-383]
MSRKAIAKKRLIHPKHGVRHIRLLRKPFQIIRANFRAYLIINAILYGLVFTGMVAAMLFPNLSATRVAILEDNGTADLVRSLFNNPWLFALTILGVNVMTCALRIVLPSLLVPFTGIAIFAYKAFTLGLAMAPSTKVMAVALIPHSLTILIEFQAYALLMFGAYILGRSWVRPATIDARNHRQGYVRGLQQLGWLSLATLPLFIIGAIWEAFSLRYLVPPLTQWFL